MQTAGRRFGTKYLLIILTCVFLITATLFFSWRSTKEFEASLVSNTQRDLLLIAESTAQSIQTMINQVVTSLRVQSENPVIIEAAALSKKDEFLLEKIGFLPTKITFNILDGKVDVLYRLDRYGTVLGLVPNIQDFVGDDYSAKPGMDSVLSNHRMSISEVFTTVTQFKAISINYPVFDKTEFVGALRALIFLQTINEKVSHIVSGKVGVVQVIDDTGEVLSSPEPKAVGRNIFEVEREFAKGKLAPEKEKAIKNMLLGGKGAVFFSDGQYSRKNAEGKEIFVYAPIKLTDRNWSICLSVDFNQIAGPVHRHAVKTIGAAIFLSIIFIVGTLLFFVFERKKVVLENRARMAETLEASNRQLLQEIEERKRITEALKESQRRMETLMGNMPGMAYRCKNDDPWTMEFVSSGAVALTGYKTGELINNSAISYPDIIHPADRKFVREQTQKAVRNKSSFVMIYRIITAAQEEKWVWEQGCGVYDDAGNLLALEGLVTDITERKIMEEEIRESQERYRTFINSTPDMAFLKDDKGHYLILNRSLADFFQLAEEDVIGKTDFDLMPKQFAEQCAVSDFKAMQTGKVVVSEESHGAQVFETYKFPVRVENKTFLGGFIRDVSVQRRAEKMLRESQQYLSDIVNFLPDPTFVIDMKGMVTAWNKAMEELTGVPGEKIIGKGEYEYAIPFYNNRRPILIDLVLKPDLEIERLYPVIHKEKDCWVGEITIPEFRGRKTALWFRASPLYDIHGTIIGAIESIRDITSRKQAEEKIKNSLKEKEVLLKEINHRVKNNLQVISSLLNLQTRYMKNPEDLEMIKVCQNRVKSMVLVHEKLYKSADLAHIDFELYMRDLVSNLFSSYAVSTGKIELMLDVQKDLAFGVDWAIPCGLIITELVSNALKYGLSGAEGGMLSISLAYSDKLKKYLLVVRNTGKDFPAGIDFRDTQSLGMQLVVTLVNQLKGTIELDRANGTTFTIAFGAQTEISAGHGQALAA